MDAQLDFHRLDFSGSPSGKVEVRIPGFDQTDLWLEIDGGAVLWMIAAPKDASEAVEAADGYLARLGIKTRSIR